MIVLVDTNVLVALALPRERLHERATKDLEKLARHEFRVLPSVLAEACFLVSTGALRLRLAGLLEALRAKYASEPVAERVFEWLARYAEREPDWVDGCLVVMASREQRVWSYDDEFRAVWRRLDGTRVPLVGAAA